MLNWTKIVNVIAALQIIGGVIVTIFGMVELTEEVKYGLSLNVVWELSTGMIVAGIVLIFTSLIGIFGVWKQNNIIILWYIMSSLLIGMGLMSFGVSGIVLKYTKSYIEVKNDLEDFFSNYYFDEDTRTHIDDMQASFKCCGVEDFRFWLGGQANDVTIGCCKDPDDEDCYRHIGLIQDAANSLIYTEGCYPSVTEHFRQLTMTFSIITCIISLLAFTSATLASCLIPHSEQSVKVVI